MKFEHIEAILWPFWTYAYSPRDKEMFVCGYEFALIIDNMANNYSIIEMVIHRENESKVKIAAYKLERTVNIRQCETEFDPTGTRCYLTVGPMIIEGHNVLSN